MPHPYDITIFLDPSDSMDQGGVSARLDHLMDWARLDPISAYRQQSFDVQFDITLTPATSIREPVPFPPFALIIPLPTVNVLVNQKADLAKNFSSCRRTTTARTLAHLGDRPLLFP